MLQNWKDADDSGAKSDIDEEVKRQVHIDFGKDALHVKIIAMVYLKRSGIRFAPLRDEFDNDYSKGCDNFTNETSIKHRRICLYKVPSVWTSRTVTGETHAKDGGKGLKTGESQHFSTNETLPKGYTCF